MNVHMENVKDILLFIVPLHTFPGGGKYRQNVLICYIFSDIFCTSEISVQVYVILVLVLYSLTVILICMEFLCVVVSPILQICGKPPVLLHTACAHVQSFTALYLNTRTRKLQGLCGIRQFQRCGIKCKRFNLRPRSELLAIFERAERPFSLSVSRTACGNVKILRVYT